MGQAPGRWKPAEATRRINECARSTGGPTLTLVKHVKERLVQRDLTTGDLLHLLKTGFVYDEPEESTQIGYFKYRVEGKTPNSEGRMVRAVVIPNGGCELKIITIMWRDER